MKTIFVSSTFKDMHYERDAIRDTTAPILNEEAKKYGDEVDFCDLRWGINTGDLDTEEGSRKVLDVCLDEIDRSEPPMVVLLGYRYGWIPDASLIKTAADRKQLELEDLERSVTALEIEYGALCDKKKFENTFFYFRKIEGDAPSDYLAEDREHEEKISALKNRIKSITGGNIREYTLKWNGSGFDGVDDFAGELAEDIKEMLMHEWQETENLTDFQRERRTHAAYIREKNVMFKARQAEAEKLMEDALSQPVTIIKGEVGSGKSTLFCHMTTELEKSGWTILPFISGLTMQSNSARDIIENTVYFIEEELRLDHYKDEVDPQTGKKEEHAPYKWQDRLAKMCAAYAKTGAKLLIMVDAADQLAPDEERDELHFIPGFLSEEIHFVMTCTTDFKTSGREHYTLRQLNDEDKLDVINGILARCGREISKPVIYEMLELTASASPLYLSLLVQRLLMMNREDFADIRSRGDGMATIEQYQLELIRNKCPDDLDEMSAALLSEAGKRINEKLVSKAAQYLAVSRSGLRRKDMSALLGEEWTEIDFAHFISYMRDCFLLRDDGRYDFTHKSIRAGFRGQCEDPDAVNREILEYFKSLETDDPVRMSEIIYHAIAADEKKFFVDYVIKHAFDSHIISHAVRDVHAQCFVDDGQWIIDVLSEAKKYDADDKLCNLIHFCNKDLYIAIMFSLKFEIQLSILTANIDLSEHLYHKLKSNESKRNLSDSYDAVALAKRFVYMDEDQELELFEKSMTIREQLVAEFGTPQSKEELSDSYARVARIYNSHKYGNWQRALELYEKSLAIREQLAAELDTAESKSNLASSYYSVAGIYEKLGGNDNLNLALELYEKGLTINEQLAAESGAKHDHWWLSDTYDKVVGIYKALGGSDNIKRALELYEKDLKNWERLAKEHDTPQIKSKLSFSYHKVAGVYEEFGGSDNLKRALELYEKGLTITEQLDTELGITASKNDLFFSYYKVAGIYKALGGTDNLKRAQELYIKSLTIKELLNNGWEGPESKLNMSSRNYYIGGSYTKLFGDNTFKRIDDNDVWRLEADLYAAAAEIYETRGGTDNLKRALELYGKAAWTYDLFFFSENTPLELYEKTLTISEQLAKELGTTQSKRDLSRESDHVAGIYEKHGGSDNLKRALELYEKSLTIKEQLAAELGTEESKIGLASSYDKVADLYDSFESRDKQRALELYGKHLKIREQLAAESGTEKSKKELSLSYYKVARIYEKLGGSDHLKLAMELHEKALTINEQLVAEFSTAESKRDLSISYDKAAGIYEALGGSDNLKSALELRKKSLTISEQLDAVLGTDRSKSDLSIRYINVAEIYKKFSGSGNLKLALELYEKGHAINEQLAKELDTTPSKKDLSSSYHGIAGIYEELGGNDNLRRALELHEKGLTIREQLLSESATIKSTSLRELFTNSSKWDLSISYMNVAGILEKLGGSDNLTQALALYHKTLAIREPLADTLQSPDAYGDLTECLLKTARHPSTSASDKKTLLTRSLEISKELYEKTNLDKYNSYIDECEELLRDC